MKIAVVYLIFKFFVSVVLACPIQNKAELIPFLVDDTMHYQTSSYIVSMGNDYDVLEKANQAIAIEKALSDKHIYSMIVNIRSLTKVVDYYYGKIVKPLYITFIETGGDFEDFLQFIDETPIRKPINFFAWLIIFQSSNTTLMSICEKPVKNYFHLVFNAKMRVICYYRDSGTILVREWYAIDSNETLYIDYGIWTPSNVTLFLGSGLYTHRHLNGVTIRSTTVANQTSDFTKGIISFLADVTNFVNQMLPAESVYGGYNTTTKKWNGVISKLESHETEIGVGEFGMTERRLQVLDFSLPILIVPGKYYIKRPNDNVLPWSMYLKAIGKRCGTLLISIVIIVPSFVACIIAYKVRRNTKNVNNLYLKTLRDSYLDVFGIFCKMPLTKLTDFSSLRIIYLSLYILAFTISSAYSGILMSYLTIFKPLLPFNSINSLMEDGTYRIAVSRYTNYYEYFSSPGNADLKKFLLNDDELPTTYMDVVEMGCRDDKIVIFMEDFTINSKYIEPSCELVAFDQAPLMSMAIVFEKHSPYTHYFNVILQKMQSYGLLQVLRLRNMRMHSKIDSRYEPVSTYSVLPIFLLLIVGMLLSLVILICEKIHYHVSLRNNKFAKSRTHYWTPLIRPNN